MRFRVYLAILALSLWGNISLAEDVLKTVKISKNVYALVGPLGNRAPDNLGNNCNFGVIVTPEGVVLIDSGASYKGAEAIHAKIQTITSQPVRIVINTGGQDHRWLGNSYFIKQGARIIANRKAVSDQKARFQAQYNTLSSLIGDKLLAGTEAVYADKQFDSAMKLSLGGIDLEIHHVGQAHTPGDSFVWLPQQKIVFTSDIVYTERMLGVLAYSNSKTWLDAFNAIAALQPAHLVPGHGHPTDLQTARRDTYDYLTFLRTAVRDLIDAGIGIENVGKLDQEKFSYLKNYEILKGRNAQRVYEEMEFE
ncbi:MBL fold metallo-hydrolase [Sulfuriflexus mobilis]|uniref:MBL fold metallo-hydrolase n=1 Tax=Sulfuriflexus mobilis TaxID=1811807 RepID=UPI000F8283C4|nr:MBL fold metallo-hydrolase [Sulfuriflexus mobilis]